MTRLYVERRLSLSAIAKKLGVCNVTVLRNLERHGIERRPCGGRIYHDAVFNPERVGPLPIPKSHRYWLAAIIDGEGWIGAVKMKNGPKTADVYYYGYWVYDDLSDTYIWFPADYVIVDSSWVEYVP